MKNDQILTQNSHWSNAIESPFPITRDLYGSLVESLDIHPITYLTGTRRIGKSILFKQLIHHLLSNGRIPPKQILFYSFPPKAKEEDLWDVWRYFRAEISDPNQKSYIFFDEIQYVENYEIVIKQLYDTFQDIKICLTGSLSLSYKRRMHESLAGRYISYRLFPLSFTEYLRISKDPTLSLLNNHNKEPNPHLRLEITNQINPTFRHFLHHGRFPEMISLPETLHASYLNSLIDQSLGQDAFAYFDINDPLLLRAIYSQLIIQNGGLVSLSKLSSTSTAKTTARYLDILELMGLVYLVYNSTNPVIKLNSSRKSYVNSAFFLNNPPFDIATSMGLAVESYILERLLSAQNEVSFWHQRQNEVDFIIKKSKIAYEVKFRQDLETPKTLLSYCAKNHFKPTLITLNQSQNTNDISHLPAFSF